VKSIANFLKKSGKVKVPDWADVVKLAKYNELAPYDPDWYFVRTASIARHLYFRSPAGVGAFRKVYGGRKRRGTEPAHFVKGSSSVIRKCLQTLEALKWVDKDANKGGRVLTRQGRKDLDRISSQLKQTVVEDE